MTFGPKKPDVFRLLENLKQVEAGYPPDLFANRRRDFIQRVAHVAWGTSNASGNRRYLTTVANGNTASMVGGVLETGLAIILLAETFAAAILYWDEIFDFVRAFSSNW